MSVSSGKQERFHFLDALRAIAATMVVIHHSVTANVIRFCDGHHIHFVGKMFSYVAAYGVNLFFVLSGVVLMRPYLRRQRQLKIGTYFYRRFTRIYPPYFVAVLFGALVIWYINTFPTWYNEKGIHAQFSWWETIKEMPIVNLDGGYYNLAWWSLGIEIVFYLLVPLIVFIYPSGKKLTDAKLIATILAGIVVTLLLQAGVSHYFPRLFSLDVLVLNVGMFVYYPVCFLMGVLIAAKDFDIKHGWLFLVMGVLCVIASELWWPPLIHSAYGLIFGAVIVFAFNIKSFRDALSKPFMIWLGERSYSLFLVHFSVFYLIDNLVAYITPERNAMYAILTRGFGIPVALFAAMLLFHFVERRTAHGLMTSGAFWPWQVRKEMI